MKDINKIIDSLSPGEQNVMHYKRDLIKVPSTLLRRMDLDKPSDKYENGDHGTICNLAFETPEMAHLAYAIYLNT